MLMMILSLFLNQKRDGKGSFHFRMKLNHTKRECHDLFFQFRNERERERWRDGERERWRERDGVGSFIEKFIRD